MNEFERLHWTVKLVVIVATNLFLIHMCAENVLR